jgi:hypothetical protein
MGDAQALGVAAVKEQPFHRDSTARVIVYSRILDSRGPHLRLVGSQRNLEILRSNLADRIELPEVMPDNLLEERDIAPFRQLLEDVRKFAARYTRGAPLLEPYRQSLGNHISRFDSGSVRFEGAWISKSEFESILEERRRLLREKHLMEIEALASRRDREPDAGAQTAASTAGLGEAVEPLWNGGREGAGFAVENLTRLASQQTGASKVRTERLLSAVRNLYLAEARVTQRIIASAAETRAAAVHERNAKEWLTPNGLGTVHPEQARDAREKAMEIRRNSASGIAACKQELQEQIQEIETVARDFHKLGETRVAAILRNAANIVGGRHITAAEPDADL